MKMLVLATFASQEDLDAGISKATSTTKPLTEEPFNEACGRVAVISLLGGPIQYIGFFTEDGTRVPDDGLESYFHPNQL